MATNTTNYNFKKPDESDFYSVQDQNNNWDKADTTLKDLDTPTFEDYSGSTTVPDAATAINNIKSKGKLSTILSNMKAAFKGACLIGQIVNNCVTNNAKLPLSAAQGKALMDLYTQLNSDLANLKNAVGADYWSSVESINISANNWATGTKKITLPPGRYIVIAHAEFPPGENVGTLSVAGSSIVERQQSFYGSMLIRRVTTTFFEIATSQKELKVTLWSNTAMTAQDCEIMAIRIK